jgi:hypothetical protein
LFEPKLPPRAFFSQSWIISLPPATPDIVKTTVTEFLDCLETALPRRLLTYRWPDQAQPTSRSYL